MNMTEVSRSQHQVPVHLRKYLANQHYNRYTPVNQAVWRFVMRQNTHFLEGKAHPAFVSGLRASGIKTESIPRVEEMNASLNPFGWGAAIISGFIPGVAFFDFQAHGILPIAIDIRKLENIKYTPAPDIIHEAAGHAPILCDPEYANYVKIFGEIGSKALATKEEHDVFDAVKHLSDIMESGTATPEDIQAAKETLEEKQQAATEISEAELVSRLYWWTVEYGMIGTLDDPKLFGAGLLSSIDEGMNSVTDKVKKLPFSLESCTQTAFDITTQQPQLFVCESFDQLIQAIQDLSEKMAFKIGGTPSLDKAVKSAHLATAVYSSGLQVSGTFTSLEKDSSGEAVYFNTTGPTALAADNKELPGHGTNRHHPGFGSPIGKLADSDVPIEDLTDDELFRLGIIAGEHSVLNFNNGVTVSGVVEKFIKNHNKIILITFSECTVTFEDRELFKPEWGAFDMAAGATIDSVFAGAADNEAFFREEIEKEAETVSLQAAASAEWTPVDELYQRVRDLRESNARSSQAEELLIDIKIILDRDFPSDWLLRLEMLEILENQNTMTCLVRSLRTQLHGFMDQQADIRQLIENGLELIEAKMSEGA